MKKSTEPLNEIELSILKALKSKYPYEGRKHPSDLSVLLNMSDIVILHVLKRLERKGLVVKSQPEKYGFWHASKRGEKRQTTVSDFDRMKKVLDKANKRQWSRS